MKQQLNEVRRLQKIAGILNESDINIGDRFVDTQKDQTLTIKKISGNSVHIESDNLQGHVWHWPKEELEKQIESGRLEKEENKVDEDMATGFRESLGVKKETSEEGNTQIILSVLGGGFSENQLTLSVPEAEALVELGKKFLMQRKAMSIGVNTPGQEGKYGAQSTIEIDPDGLKCVIGRIEDLGGSGSYRGYDEKSGSSTGRLRASQSIVYQIVEDLPSKL